jgi:hypothetical protein
MGRTAYRPINHRSTYNTGGDLIRRYLFRSVRVHSPPSTKYPIFTTQNFACCERTSRQRPAPSGLATTALSIAFPASMIWSTCPTCHATPIWASVGRNLLEWRPIIWSEQRRPDCRAIEAYLRTGFENLGSSQISKGDTTTGFIR